jgi:hypothetical protein
MGEKKIEQSRKEKLLFIFFSPHFLFLFPCSIFQPYLVPAASTGSSGYRTLCGIATRLKEHRL